MLCLDMRLVRILRGDRGDEQNSRDRSKSVFVQSSSVRSRTGHDVSAFKLFHRRASSAISTASDLISRRGVFSRRYFGSVEQLQPEQDGQEHSRRFRLENGDSPGEKDEMFGSPCTPVLENPEYQTRWYFKYFLGKLHQNYVGVDGEKNPFFLSVVMSDNQCVPLYRGILFKRTGAQKMSLPYPPASKVLTVKQILANFPGMERIEKGPREITAPDIQKDLLLLEEQEGSVNFKFGVVYMKSGQTSDDDMLSNEDGSPDFEDFVSLLGDRIRLKGWDKYRGGLDVKGDMTGKYSVYTIYEGHEIMFHISTLLPYSKDNKQQVERKRHIGNDIVNIIFIDKQSENDDHKELHTKFNPSCVKSQFTHVFAIVSVDESGGFRLSVWSDETVPLFGPSLPCPPVFHCRELFRQFLLVKLINGEKATFETPTFSRKRERTLDMLIKDLYQEHVTDARMTMLNRRAFSDVLAETPRHTRIKEDARQIEFVRIGQALKLEAIMRGDAPTSLASAGCGAYRRSPWEPTCFYPVFPACEGVVCGDSWGDTRLVIGTDEGTFLVEDGCGHRLLLDRSMQVRQLDVIEAHGIMLVRAGHRLYVFRLSALETENSGMALTRNDCRDNRLERTRGIHLYALSRQGGGRLRMCVAASRRLLLFQWKHSAAWTAWCPANDTDTVDGFTFLWEMTVADSPTLLTVLEPAARQQHSDVLVCAGFRNHWELINGRTGHTRMIHQVEGNRPHLVAALDLYEDQEVELLLCYNHTCHFQKLNEDTNLNSKDSNFDFHWNTVPSHVVCTFPYVIAFTPESMEIRLIVNGNLVHTMSMPKLQLVAFKNDIFFATTAPEFFPERADGTRLTADLLMQTPTGKSPPGSPHSTARPLRLYRIPVQAIGGTTSSEKRGNEQRGGSTSSSLSVPDRPIMSRSAASSPVPKTRPILTKE